MLIWIFIYAYLAFGAVGGVIGFVGGCKYAMHQNELVAIPIYIIWGTLSGFIITLLIPFLTIIKMASESHP